MGRIMGPTIEKKLHEIALNRLLVEIGTIKVASSESSEGDEEYEIGN